MFISFYTEAEFLCHNYGITLDILHLLICQTKMRLFTVCLQASGGLACLEENRKKPWVLFTSGLMSTLHKVLDFRVINQTRLVKKVEVGSLRAHCFLFSHQIKRNLRRSLKSEMPVNVLKAWGRGVFRSLSKLSEVSSALIL